MKDRILKVLVPELEAMGIDLVDIELSGLSGNKLLRLYIDKIGETQDKCTLSIDECEKVSRSVERLLDVEELLGRKYSLEVSTPGVERKLRNINEYNRFKGRLASVVLNEEGPKGTAFTGRIKEIKDGDVTFDCEGKDIKVNLSDIKKAKLKFER